MKKVARYGKTVLALVLLAAMMCPAVLSEGVTHTDHVWDPSSRTRTKPATCTEPAWYTYTCSLCGATKSALPEGDPDPSAHDWGDWTVTNATCTEAGYKERVCNNNVHHTQRIEIPATGHDYGPYVVTTAPTCTEPGVETSTCKNDSSHTLTRPVAATGHDWDNGKDDPAPTCTEPGKKVYTCKNDPSHTKTETVPATGHDWDNGTVTTPATCTTPGEKTVTCKNDPSHTKTETIPATGHDWDNGKVIKEATVTQEGEILYTCKNDPSHTKTEKIPRRTLPNNTICAFGPRLRDVNLYPYDTDQWYMFTPFDASKDGRQTYELVITNRFIVGTLTIDIRDGEMTVDYQLVGDTIDVSLEFFTVLNQLDDIHVYEPEDLLDLRMTTRRPINLQETFGDDRNLVLYFCSRATYTYNNKFKSLDYNSQAHQRLVRQMLEIMD